LANQNIGCSSLESTHSTARTPFLALADGTLYPISDSGAFTIRRLRLNRPPLVAYRLRSYRSAEEARLLTELRQLISLQKQLQQQHAFLLSEQQQLLEQQRELLTLLLKQVNNPD